MEITLFEELKSSGNLPTPSGVGVKILRITETDDYDVKEMSRTIMADSSLTGRILQLANSANFGSEQPTTTVDESIMRLGSSTVRTLSLAFSLVSERKQGTCKAFDYSGYWSTSLARAVVAPALSVRLNIGRPEEAYVCGLLSGIGSLALASVFPEGYSVVLEEHRSRPQTELKLIEQGCFGIDHAEVAVWMATDWRLPESFKDAIQCSLEQRIIGPGEGSSETLTDVLRIADAFACAMAMDESAGPAAWDLAGQQFLNARQMLGLEDSAFVAFFDTCIAEWDDWGRGLKVLTQPQRTSESLENLIARMVEEQERAEAQGGSLSSQVPALEPKEPSSEQSAPTSILLVDDEPVSLRILQMQLHRNGYDVFVATSGEEALELALKRCPDIVVADWQMPGMDGMELCRTLRRSVEGRDIYFLLLTGNGDAKVIVKAFDAGVDDLVYKPFIAEVMDARIKGGERLVQLNRKVEKDKRTMMRQVTELGVLTRKLRATALTDELTGLPNRRFAIKCLDSEWKKMKRTGHDLTLIMIDIDHFKSVNDEFGHDAGDVVLRETARVFRDSMRAGDEICRIGGEEFLLICRGASEEESVVVAERVRAGIEAHVMPIEGFSRALTVSLGVASIESSMSSIDEFLKFADNALYAAKNNGRNRIVRHSKNKAA